MDEALVRRAEARDFEPVARLLEELGRGALTPAVEPVYRERYLRHLSRPDTASLVAEVDGVVVGFLGLEFRERLNRLAWEAWIPDLIVAAPYRGRGVGKALLLRAFEAARAAGCSRVVLESGHARTVAHRLYRSVGMVERGIYLDLLLSEATPV
ncbi:MAG TPA: GNAT family N-acetyltransferase [Chloroflexota bacterium]